MSENMLQPIFDIFWSAGASFGRWLFDGWITEKIDFEPLWNEIHLCNSIGNKPILLKENKTDRTQVYMFSIPVGMSIKDFMQHNMEIAQYLHCDTKDLRIKLINNLAAITVYDTENLSFNYNDYDFKIGKEIRIPIGISLEDFSTVYWNPTSPNEAHILVGGSTGAGKSVALNVIMEYLINRNDVEIYIQDTKLVDMYDFKDEDNVIQYNPGTDYAAETVAHLVDEMNNRYEYLKRHGFKSLVECNRKDRPKFLFLFVEELASFSPKDDKDYYKGLAELLAKGRAAGITVAISTQAPYSEILPGMLKNNINTTLGLKTKTGEASKVICNNYDALTSLRGRGHGILFNANGEVEIQVFNIN